MCQKNVGTGAANNVKQKVRRVTTPPTVCICLILMLASRYGVATISRLLENVGVSFEEYRLFYRSLLQKRLMILKSRKVASTPYLTRLYMHIYKKVSI